MSIHRLWIAILTFICVLLAIILALPSSCVLAGEPVTHPSSCHDRTLGDPSWLDNIGQCLKQPENPEEICEVQCLPASGCVPYCLEDILQELTLIDLGQCPAVLPALGKPIALAMVSGYAHPHAGWEVDVGFGPGRPLNYLSRLHISSNGRIARVFLPSAQRSAEFSRVAEGVFELADGGMSLPGGSQVVVTQTATDDAAIVTHATMAELRFSDGRLWRYELAEAVETVEAPEAAESTAERQDGQVFRIIEMRDRRGLSDKVAYGEDVITLTDTSGNPYRVLFDPQTRRIEQIDVLDRSWMYAWEHDPATGAATVSETAPDGSVSSVTVNAAGWVTRKEQASPDGPSRSMEIEYDAAGRITRAREGSVWLSVEESVNEHGQTVRTLHAGDVVRRAIFEGERLAGRADGIDNRATRSTVAATRFDFAEQTDALGRIWTKTHNAAGKLLSSRSPDDREMRYLYDERGNTLERITPEGTYSFEYDDYNRVIRETRPTGAVLTFTRDAEGRITEQTNALGYTTRFTYNTLGQIASRTAFFASTPLTLDDPAPPTWRYEYDAWGNLTSQIDPLGNAATLEYDLSGNLVRRTDAAGNVTQYAYDGLSRKVREIDVLGGTTEWVYDDRGLVVEVKDSTAGVDGAGAHGGHAGCGSCGGASGVYDKPGRYEYNEAKLLTMFTDVMGNATQYEYNDLGQRVKVIDALGAETAYAYDLEGNLLAVTNPLGAITRNEYDKFGRLIARSDPLGRTTRYEYDVYGRQTAVIAPGGATSRTEYDEYGRLAKIIAPNGAETLHEYNVAGQLIRQIDALGVVTEYAYNADDRQTRTIADAEGLRAITRYEYNDLGQLAASVNPLDHATRYEYNSLGQMVKLISASGAETLFEYDALGRRIRMTSPTGQAQFMEYLPGSSLVAATGRGDGIHMMWHEYDSLGRLVKKDGLDAVVEEYTYDAIGQQTEVNRAGAVTKAVFDLAGRIIESIDPLGHSTRMEYDAAGQLVAVVNALNYAIRFEYDDADRQTKTFLPGGGVLENVYNEAGQLVETRGGPQGTKRYEYDALGRQVAEINALGGRKTTQYDSLGRVIRLANEMDQPVHYEYNAAGNRTALIDANGNRTVWEYNADGRQTSMTFANGDREEYAYDGMGRMIQKTTPNGEFIRYAYDQNTGFLMRVDVEGDVPYIREIYTQLYEDALEAGLPVEPIDFASRNFSVVYIRDEQGRVLTETCPQTTMTHVYNERGQLASVHNSTQNAFVHHQYDERSARSGLRLEMPHAFPNPQDLQTLWLEPIDFNIDYGRDDHGRLIDIRVDNGEPLRFAYDLDGGLTGLLYPNGLTISQEYDANRNLHRQMGGFTQRGLDGAVVDEAMLLFDAQYRRDGNGNLTGINGPWRMADYGYDKVGRLIYENGEV